MTVYLLISLPKHRVYGRYVYMVLANPARDSRLKLARTIYIYIYIYMRCIYSIIGREITEYMVMYTVYMVLANPTRDSRLKLARTIHIYGVYTVFLAGKSLNIRSCTPYVYGAGQPYT
jgi:hypothetical protein